MLVSAQHIVNDATNKILEKVQNNIKIIEKVNQNKSSYSSKKIFTTLEQLTQQISNVPNDYTNLQSPLQNNNLRLDSYMSVFNVEKKLPQVKHTSLNKNIRRRKTTISQNEIIDKKIFTKGTLPYNHLEKLAGSSQNSIKIQQDQQQQQFADKIRQQKNLKQKQLLHIIKPQKPKLKILSAHQLKQKISYDYQCNRMKVKTQARRNLIMSQKSLLSYYSNSIVRKQLLQNLKQPEATFIQTQKISVNMKKKSKKLKQTAQHIDEPIQIQFSKIRNLTQNFVCEGGVNMKFQGQFLKSRRSKTQISQTSNKRYSKLDYLLLKKRSQSQNHQKYTYRSLGKQTNLSQEKETENSKLNLITISTEKSTSKSKVQIANQQMLKYLLAPDYDSTPVASKQITIDTELKNAPLDFIDRFNLNYIKNRKNVESKLQKPTQHNLLPNIHHQKTPYLKVRQKIQNKKLFLMEMKKKFQQSLRQSKSDFNNSTRKQNISHKLNQQIQ